MNENEMIVVEQDEQLTQGQAEEQVEQASIEKSQTKTYTEDELNARVDELLGKKIARREAKIRKEYDRRYGALESVVKAGLGTDDLEQATNTLAQFYAKNGKAPKKPNYSARELEILAKAEADEIIQSGFDEVVDEVERLKRLGPNNMSEKEKAVFKALAEHRQSTERHNALSAIGVTDNVYNSKEFQEFADMFKSDVPITEIYKTYAKSVKPTNIEPIGSMKNGSHDEGKTYYTPEEVDKLTAKDLDNPIIFRRVRESMKSW